MMVEEEVGPADAGARPAREREDLQGDLMASGNHDHGAVDAAALAAHGAGGSVYRRSEAQPRGSRLRLKRKSGGDEEMAVAQP